MKKSLIFIFAGILLISSVAFSFAKEEESSDVLFSGKITKVGEDSIKFKSEDGKEYSAIIDSLTYLVDKSYDEINFEKFKKGQSIKVWGILAYDDFHIVASFTRNLSIK